MSPWEPPTPTFESARSLYFPSLSIRIGSVTSSTSVVETESNIEPSSMLNLFSCLLLQPPSNFQVPKPRSKNRCNARQTSNSGDCRIRRDRIARSRGLHFYFEFYFSSIFGSSALLVDFRPCGQVRRHYQLRRVNQWTTAD